MLTDHVGGDNGWKLIMMMMMATTIMKMMGDAVEDDG